MGSICAASACAEIGLKFLKSRGLCISHILRLLALGNLFLSFRLFPWRHSCPVRRIPTLLFPFCHPALFPQTPWLEEKPLGSAILVAGRGMVFPAIAVLRFIPNFSCHPGASCLVGAVCRCTRKQRHLFLVAPAQCVDCQGD